MDMIEKVARAIYDGHPSVVADKREAESIARTAIAAMREPTEDMIEAAYTGYDSEGYGIGRSDAANVWAAMIGEALSSPQYVVTEDAPERIKEMKLNDSEDYSLARDER